MKGFHLQVLPRKIQNWYLQELSPFIKESGQFSRFAKRCPISFDSKVSLFLRKDTLKQTDRKLAYLFPYISINHIYLLQDFHLSWQTAYKSKISIHEHFGGYKIYRKVENRLISEKKTFFLVLTYHPHKLSTYFFVRKLPHFLYNDYGKEIPFSKSDKRISKNTVKFQELKTGPT